MTIQTERDRMLDAVRADPNYLYSYSPTGAEADRRYVFADKTCTSLSSAYLYATDVTA